MANPRGNPNWRKGVGGNPRGLSPGSRHKITLLAEQMVGDDGPAVIRKCIDMAKSGNEVAMRLVVERILPPRKDRPINFELPESLITARDVSEALSGVIAQTAKGDISPDEATNVTALLEAKRRAIETCELEARISRLEERTGYAKRA